MEGEVIPGPHGNFLVPDDLEILRADGFMLRRAGGDDVVLDILGSSEDASGRVIARLAFDPEGFGRFVRGLVAVRRLL